MNVDLSFNTLPLSNDDTEDDDENANDEDVFVAPDASGRLELVPSLDGRDVGLWTGRSGGGRPQCRLKADSEEDAIRKTSPPFDRFVPF